MAAFVLAMIVNNYRTGQVTIRSDSLMTHYKLEIWMKLTIFQNDNYI